MYFALLCQQYFYLNRCIILYRVGKAKYHPSWMNYKLFDQRPNINFMRSNIFHLVYNTTLFFKGFHMQTSSSRSGTHVYHTLVLYLPFSVPISRVLWTECCSVAMPLWWSELHRGRISSWMLSLSRLVSATILYVIWFSSDMNLLPIIKLTWVCVQNQNGTFVLTRIQLWLARG